MPFIDIAFQAEVSRYEDAEFSEIARRHCGEDPLTRAQVIKEFRRMIFDRGEVHPRRTDDAYLLRFLRCRRFIPALAHKLVLAALNFYSHGSYQASVGEDSLLGLSQPSASRCINMTSLAIVSELAQESIRFPSSPEEIQKTKRDFLQLYGMPDVIGAVDGTHIAIFKPPNNHLTAPGSLFFNRKGFYSINVQMMMRYEQFRWKNAYLYDCSAFGLQKVKNVYGGCMPDSPESGRITLMRFGRWDPEQVPIVDVVRCALLMDEIAVMQPRLQILGVTIIVDLEGLSLRHVRHLTPTIASQIVSLMGVSFPLPNHGLHIINYSWILNTFFYVFKQFIPSAAWDRLHFHGYDMSSLHKHIDPKYLPPEYGGSCPHVISTEEWISKIDKYKDDFMVDELRALGFSVDDYDEAKLVR